MPTAVSSNSAREEPALARCAAPSSTSPTAASTQPAAASARSLPELPPKRASPATAPPIRATTPSRKAQRASNSKRELRLASAFVVAATPAGETRTPNAKVPSLVCPSTAEKTFQLTV